MCFAHPLIVLNICVKFHEIISDGIRVMEWTRMMKLMDGWTFIWTFLGYYSVNVLAQNTQQDA